MKRGRFAEISEEEVGRWHRAYQLLEQLYDAGYTVKPHWKAEVEVLVMPEWQRRLDEE
jgi:hypothetical protein